MSAYDFIEKRFSDPNINLDDIIKLMEEYATECVKTSLEKASENIKVNKLEVWSSHLNQYVITHIDIIKDSINNHENIVLL